MTLEKEGFSMRRRYSLNYMVTYSWVRPARKLATFVEHIVGAGLSDYLTDTNIDSNGMVYPPLGVMNDESYTSIQDPSLPKILYIIYLSFSFILYVFRTVYNFITFGLFFIICNICFDRLPTFNRFKIS